MSVFRILQVIFVEVDVDVACENIRFSLLFAAALVTLKRPQWRRAGRNGCIRRLM